MNPESLQLGGLLVAIFLSTWIVISPKRFTKFWLLPADKAWAVWLVRGFWSLCLVGAVGQLVRAYSPTVDKQTALLVGAIGSIVAVGTVLLVEHMNRLRVAPKQPSEIERYWADFKRHRRLSWMMWLGFPFVGGGVMMISYRLFGEEYGGYVVVPLLIGWVGYWIYSCVQVVRFSCPRCGKRFQPVWWLPYGTCRRCKLRIGEQP
jgi:hypothetical protein